MKDQGLLYGIIGLLVGIVVTGGIMSYSGKGMGGSRSSHSGMSMEDMSKELQGKSGDDFDKAFIEMMIDHHEGAIDMAKQAQKTAKHQEIKTLADDIITAQEKEITQMKDWQKQWGY